LIEDLTDTHLLRRLELPARYEALVNRVGPEVARLLVNPGQQTKTTMERAGLAIKARGEGLLVPLVGRSGTGKTTLATNLSAFLPSEYTTTINHDGQVSFAGLHAAVTADPPIRSDQRVIPVNIDHREAAPPSAAELAEIKRFLRDREIGRRCAILWPQTSREQAAQMAREYADVVGVPPIELPVEVEGPARATWIDVGRETLRLSNAMIESLEALGVDPRDYDPHDFDTLGAFLRRISDDFVGHLHRLLTEMRVPLRLIVAFASESADAGVLSQLTTGTRYGFLDAGALLDATPESRIGKFWRGRRGALTQTIVSLDARAVCLPPTASIPILRRYGGDDVRNGLHGLGILDRGDARVNLAISRSELGKMLLGAARATFEARGTPSTSAVPAFQTLAESGFNLGKDKGYNKSMSEGLTAFLRHQGIETDAVPEQLLADSRLIPDNAITREGHVACVEYTWRKGEFLTTGNRSTVAQYILEKLKNYAVDLRWIEA